MRWQCAGDRGSQIVGGQPVDIDRQQLTDEWFTRQQWPGDRLHELTGTPDDRVRAASFTAYVYDRARTASEDDAR